MLDLFNNDQLIYYIGKIGYWGVFGIVFAETALFVGFFLPGDSLLIIAGLIAAQGALNPWILISGVIFFGVLGYFVAYYIGVYVGNKMLLWPDRWFYKKEHLIRSRDFFHQRGLAAIILGRFIPIVRTFIPIVAGMSQMPKRRYAVCNFIGGVLWGGGLPLLGILLAKVIPSPKEHLKTIIVAIVFVSLIPIMISVFNNYRLNKRNKRTRV